MFFGLGVLFIAKPAIYTASWIRQRISADCDNPPLLFANRDTASFSAGVSTNPNRIDFFITHKATKFIKTYASFLYHKHPSESMVNIFRPTSYKSALTIEDALAYIGYIEKFGSLFLNTLGTGFSKELNHESHLYRLPKRRGG